MLPHPTPGTNSIVVVVPAECEWSQSWGFVGIDLDEVHRRVTERTGPCDLRYSPKTRCYTWHSR